MNNHLFDAIDEKSGAFSKGQKKIAAFITSQYDKAAFMTAAKLGKTVGVSESTVVRFAAELGFAGYPQLQQAMQELIRNRLTSVQRIELTNSRIGESDVLTSVMTLDIEKIRRTMEETSREEFDRAVDLLCGAKRIYILGTRSSSALASFLGYYLALVFEDVKFVDPSNESEIFEQMLHLSSADAVIGISFPRYSSKVIKAMRFASDRGADTIALTDAKSSPLAQLATCRLLAKSDMASFVDSLVAPLSMINALIVATALRKREQVEAIFSRLESVWAEYGVYDTGIEDKSNG